MNQVKPRYYNFLICLTVRWPCHMIELHGGFISAWFLPVFLQTCRTSPVHSNYSGMTRVMQQVVGFQSERHVVVTTASCFWGCFVTGGEKASPTSATTAFYYKWYEKEKAWALPLPVSSEYLQKDRMSFNIMYEEKTVFAKDCACAWQV